MIKEKYEEAILGDEVRYTGAQDLILTGRGATLSGATVGADIDTWNSGLFVSESGGNLAIYDLTFADSFNNGLAVFVPAGGDDVKIKLTRVDVTDAQFHGVLIDGQATTGYNTDDFIHPACVDPYSTNAGVDIEVDVRRSSITGAGQLVGYDISQATGCPQDFDGLRVDQGGDGDLTAKIVSSTFDENLADGVELDEKGDGSVKARVTTSTFNDDGDTVAITCTDAAECGDDTGELIEDLDDGFDIDEEDAGDLIVTVLRSEVNDNKDEGMDMDEAGDGSIVGRVVATEASRNGDEGYKASEADGGDNTANIIRSKFEDAGNDQIEVESEDGDGSGTVTMETSLATRRGRFFAFGVIAGARAPTTRHRSDQDSGRAFRRAPSAGGSCSRGSVPWTEHPTCRNLGSGFGNTCRPAKDRRLPRTSYR